MELFLMREATTSSIKEEGLLQPQHLKEATGKPTLQEGLLQLLIIREDIRKCTLEEESLLLVTNALVFKWLVLQLLFKKCWQSDFNFIIL